MQLAPPVKSKKNVMVIGGGPGGMYAAITAAERGHSVRLIEKSGSLGGSLKFTDTDIYKDDLKRFKNSLIARVRKQPIQVDLSTEATFEFVERENPDALVVAIGARPIVPEIPGISLPNVNYAVNVYWEPEKVGQRVVIIGGGLVGCETALHLAALGKSVIVVEMTDRLAADATESHRIALFCKMKQSVECRTGTKCTEIVTNGILVLREDKEERIEADTVVYAVGLKAQTGLALALCGAASKQYFLVGDCINPRKVKESVHEGYHAAMDIL